MAAPRRRSAAALSETLFAQARRFGFFQAVRLLGWVLGERARRRGGPPPAAVGHDDPRHEAVRFQALPSLSFPATEVAELQPPAADDGHGPARMQVTFMGLTGPAGVLPAHYTGLLLRRLRLKDRALRDFLDIFHHRSISLFYRAWEKYRLPVAWERARRDGADDPFSRALGGLIGLGTPGLGGRLAVSDDLLLYFAGHFAHRPRSAAALAALLEEFLDLPVAVRQFHGRWLALREAEQTRLYGSDMAQQYPQLGRDAVVGDRVWDVGGKFRLRLGPLRGRQFRQLLPDGPLLARVGDLTRAYVGVELDFDVQLVLETAAIPPCRLEADSGPRLGWSAWLGEAAAGAEADAAVFEAEEKR
ncbi:MAG: type VI secretion system baseplate subunit TssG [Pseudomonadota bacterium]|nr:type VI secretion system baseplate subunit TssG [Pseudomonadota bacterium]